VGIARRYARITSAAEFCTRGKLEAAGLPDELLLRVESYELRHEACDAGVSIRLDWYYRWNDCGLWNRKTPALSFSERTQKLRTGHPLGFGASVPHYVLCGATGVGN